MIEKHATSKFDGLAAFSAADPAQGPGSTKAPDLSTPEAAAILGCSVRSVRRAIASGALRAARQGRSYRIARDDLDRYANGRPHAPILLPLAPITLRPRLAEDPAPLPEPISSFIGRESDLADVVSSLADPATRLLTLTGPGGIGKTRVAMAAAAAARAHFPDGVAFIPLDAIVRADQVMPAIAQALGLQEQAGQDRRHHLHGFLRHKRVLLVLDNFEQVLGAARDLAEILAAAPRVTVLVTSRAPLRVTGEREMPLPPLSLPGEQATAAEVLQSDAGRLFVERAGARALAVPLDDRSAPAIAAICARLDGLPLAIELAAARANLLSPQQILARLERRLPLLTRGARNAPARHGAMRDAIAWSYALLTPHEQRLFRTLAIFAGGFTLEAAEAVGGEASPPPPPPSVLDLIASLVEQSLLVSGAGPDGQPRFHMLETIREFGLDQVAAVGEEEHAREAHAHHYLAVARALRPLASLRACHAPLDQLATEQENLRVALHWLSERGAPEDFVELAAALGLSWFAYGSYREGRGWLEQALVQVDQATLPNQARLLIGYAGVLFGQGEFSRMEPMLARGLDLVQAAGDPLDTALALILRGATRNRDGQYVAAEAPLRQALALSDQIGDPRLRAAAAGRALANLTASACGQFDFARSMAYGEEALRRCDGHQLDLAEGMTLMTLGTCGFNAADGALAVARLYEGMVLIGERGDPRVIADVLSGIACVATDAGEHRAALLLFGAADGLRERVGAAMLWPSSIAAAERGLAVLGATLDERQVAATLAEGRALSLASALDVARHVAQPTVSTGTASSAESLTRRESEVLHLLAEGQTDRAIADALFLSRRTVNWHVRSIFAKLGVTSRGMAVTRAQECGLI